MKNRSDEADIFTHSRSQRKSFQYSAFNMILLPLLDSITNSMDMNLSKLQEIVKDRGAGYAAVQWSQRVGHDLATEQQLVFKKGEKIQIYIYAHIYSFIRYVLVVM